jgi:hypothetical protein
MLAAMMVPCLAADARAERNGAKPSRAVVARGLRHSVLTHEHSTVFGAQQEAKTNSLITVTSDASSSTPCPIRPFACHSDNERLAARSGEICAGHHLLRAVSRGGCPDRDQ